MKERIDSLARGMVFRQLQGLSEGSLTVHDDEGARTFGSGAGPHGHVRVLDASLYRQTLLGGHVGAAEAYAAGAWTSDDLTEVVRVLLRNREVLDGMEKGLSRLAQPLRKAIHLWNRNTQSGSRRNIGAHYDLSNEFFRLFLDDTLTYSSGWFERPDTSLAEASRAKYDRICRKLALRPDHHVLEIGSGWGGFALHAASRYGCRVTTTTISQAQWSLARQRVAEAGLSDRVTVLLSDYRDLDGEYDRLVSIEMIEAVGHEYFGRFFQTCSDRLRPDGLAAIQSITIQDRHYEQARREVDFIKRHIFPGSCIPSLSVLMSAAAPSDLRLVHGEDFGVHYARTLREWSRRFDAQADSIEQLGFDERFRRLWQFYFAYCEGGFLEGATGVSQLVFAKPAAALELPIPALLSQHAA